MDIKWTWNNGQVKNYHNCIINRNELKKNVRMKSSCNYLIQFCLTIGPSLLWYPCDSLFWFSSSDKWCKTGGPDSQRFLLFDNGPTSTERVIIFSTDECLQHLAASCAWYIDGNFDIAPKLFTQLYVIRVPVTGSSVFICAAYCLLVKKTRSTII